MRLVFMGTSEFAIPVLERLGASDHEIKLVVTRPDRPKGRGQKLGASPVKAWAVAHRLPMLQPEDVNAPESVRELVGASPDAAVVASYGSFLSTRVLELPKYGCLNVHPSLLPRYRGAAPVPHAIMNGDAITGVTVFRLVKKMDAGPLLGMRRMPVSDTATAGELEHDLALMGADLLVEVLDHLGRGAVLDIPQDEQQASYARKLNKEQGRLNWNDPARAIVDRIRAFHPEPLAHTVLRAENGRDVRINVLEAVLNHDDLPLAAGEIAVHGKDILIVGCGEGAVRIARLQPESRKPMTSREFINGFRLRSGARFE